MIRALRTRSGGEDWEDTFLKALADCGVIRRACEMAGIGKTAVYYRRDTDTEFATKMALALDDACDLIEIEARRRAVDGIDEPVVYKGRVSGDWIGEDGQIVAPGTPGAKFVPLTIKRYSDALMVLLLKAHRPDKYRENVVPPEMVEQLEKLEEWARQHGHNLG